MKFIKYNHLLKFAKKTLIKAGVNNFCAKHVSEGLCNASLRGTDSHGINLLPHYVNSVLNGRKNPKPKFKFYKKFNSIFLLDADDGYGISAGVKAIEKGCLVAKKMVFAQLELLIQVTLGHFRRLQCMELKRVIWFLHSHTQIHCN